MLEFFKPMSLVFQQQIYLKLLDYLKYAFWQVSYEKIRHVSQENTNGKISERRNSTLVHVM